MVGEGAEHIWVVHVEMIDRGDRAIVGDDEDAVVVYGAEVVAKAYP